MNTVHSPCPTALTGASQNLWITFLNALLAAQCSLSPENSYPKDYGPNITNGEEFDFIVVGSGTAGSVVASRLSENPEWKVLVLEAGGYPSSNTEIPGLTTTLQGTEEDWQYLTEPSEMYCLGFKDRRCRWPRGKVLGGSSAINAMIYLRGNRKDYDDWEKMGNTGWGFDAIRGYFKKIEGAFKSDMLQKDYGQDGYFKLTEVFSDHPFVTTFKEAALELGLSNDSDPLLGFFEAPMAIENGARVNVAKAYLGNAKNRGNLFLATNAHVTKITIDPDTKEATGVEVNINGRAITLKSRKEVIVSSGSVNSPQLLMLSGIGPKDHLEELGINVVQDLPVGEFLQDHTFFAGLNINIDENAVKGGPSLEDNFYEFLIHRRGAFAQLSTVNLIGLVNTRNDSIYHNVQYHVFIFLRNEEIFQSEVLRILGLDDEQVAIEKELSKNTSYLKVIVTQSYPDSYGKIKLKTNDPFDKPLIYPEYYSDENRNDLEVMLEGVRFLQKLIKTTKFARHNPEIPDTKYSKCERFDFDTDEYWKCMLRHFTSTTYHPTTTCRMGPKNDGSAVVDPRLRVYGMKNLRVIDASIMPKMVGTNTNGPTLMIAEKGSDLIKSDWLERHDEL